MKNSIYHMMYVKPSILTNSKPKFGIILALTTALMISTALVGNGFSNSVFAFSNKYSAQERYDSGVRDGNIDCQSGTDTSAYQQSAEYRGHSKYYQHGYDDTLANCSSGSSSDGSNNNDQGDNILVHHEKRDTIQTQGQDNNQKVVCIIAIGTCPTTSGQTQNAQN